MQEETAFTEILEISKSLFNKKLNDYGVSWSVYRPTTVCDQLLMKIKRIKGEQINHQLYINDSIYEDWISIINYSIIFLIQLEQETSYMEESKSAGDVQRLYEYYCTDITSLFLKKNHDYNGTWRFMRIESFSDIIHGKLLRIKTILAHGGKTEISEGVDSNIKDICMYAIFALIITK